MRKLYPLFFFITLLFSPGLFAQQPCGFDIKHKSLLESNPVFAQLVGQNNEVIRKHIEARRGLRPGTSLRPMSTVYIPVVVHVMHTGGAVGSIYNPSDAQIMGAINYLNAVYAGTHSGMTAPVEGGGVVDMEVQFALAQRTPSCGATNGINRVDASSLPGYTANGVNVMNTNGCSELSLKNFARWNPSDYYNIWIVNKLDGADGTSGQFIAGFAYFPGAPATLDGTIMLATQMESGEKTLPHEIGHALSLHHPFNGSDNDTQCPLNSDCTMNGDMVCDTDPVTNNYNEVSGFYNFSCRTGTNGCTGTSYTINTESNFMSYTNCYTLFTNGQKARAQAALTLPSRASLIDPGNLALTPCGTTINFTQATASRMEDNTGTLDGCRRYRDYTYQLSIGAAPTATATVTLSFSGTAIKGTDYDITTNGDFTSPVNVLSFAAGSTAAQTFTVRIYDDGDVESAETAVLDFTINSGGGDATKGTVAPVFTLSISDNDLAPIGASSGVYTVGVTSGAINATPFDARLQRHRAQYLYTASELAAAGVNPGNITSLQLLVLSKASTRPFGNFTIRMAHTSIPYLVDGSAFIINGMTTVYSASSYTTVVDWNNFPLTTPFTWNGTSNLAIEICFTNTAADAANSPDVLATFLDDGSAAQGNVYFQNGINCSQAFSSVSYFGSGRKPVIQLGNSIIGTAVETVASSAAARHIETASNDYFYSTNNRLMMRLTSVNSPLGCVNSVLEEAGSTWVNYQGGQRSAKVFEVSPTTNGAGAGYTASFYFTNAELAGKNPATLRLAKTSATSAAASNPGNTILLTPVVTTLGSDVTVFTATFTGFSRFFLVDAGVVLPVLLTDFKGRVNADQDAVLQWTTASEYNNRGFHIETSRNGINFVLLDSVASNSQAASGHNYEYIHDHPPAGISFYRLKQIDTDGKFTYSRIISLQVETNQVKAIIYPVPASSAITIHFGKPVASGEIEIFSADMKTVGREKVMNQTLSKNIAVGNLASGVYFIRFTSGSSTAIWRFIKE